MPKKMNRQADGKIAGENLTGRPVPKGSLKDQTRGKEIPAPRNIRTAPANVLSPRR